jgi:predicted dehydrogenase
MSEVVRFGLIGCGDIGRLRAAALAESRAARLVAVSDLDAARAQALAARHGAAVAADWRALLERDDVDAVIVSTPPVVHEEQCVAALRAGRHVLCEKPLARTPAECRAIVDAAETAGRFLATGFNYRFYPSYRRARALLDAGTIGELSHIRAYGGYSATAHAQAWVHDAAVVGGGALHDIGIHLIDLTRWYLGEPESVQGLATGAVWRYGDCEDNGFALLRGPGGRAATVHASWTEWGRYRFEVELVGTLGRIRATSFPMFVETRWSDRVGGPMRRRAERFPLFLLGEHLRSYRWVVTRSFVDEFDAFARAVQGAATPIATGEDGLRAIEIAWAASGRAGAAAVSP